MHAPKCRKCRILILINVIIGIIMSCFNHASLQILPDSCNSRRQLLVSYFPLWPVTSDTGCLQIYPNSTTLRYNYYGCLTSFFCELTCTFDCTVQCAHIRFKLQKFEAVSVDHRKQIITPQCYRKETVCLLISRDGTARFQIF